MKKILFLIVLSGLAFKLKAQQQSIIKPLERFNTNKFYAPVDTNLRISIRPQTNVTELFLPKQNAISTTLIASLDRMPIAKPTGNWNMPVVHPNGTVVYTTPIKRLPPIVKPENGNQKTNP